MSGIGEKTIFRPNKGLRLASGLMVRRGTSTLLDKKAKPDADCLPDKRKSPSLKLEEESKGIKRPSNMKSILVAILNKKKGGANRSGASKGCWITELETMEADVDNLRNSTMLLA